LANILENNFLQYLPNLSPSGNRDYCVDMLKARWLLPVFAESYLLLRVNQAKDLIAVRVWNATAKSLKVALQTRALRRVNSVILE